MNGVVIMVWMKRLDAGFGDLLRGTMNLYQLSKKMNFKLIVDTQLHPISQFLMSHPHAHSDYVIQNRPNIIRMMNVDETSIVKMIQANKHTSAPILMCTNYGSADQSTLQRISEDCKRFMRSLLIPTPEFKTYFNTKCVELKIPTIYSIIHFRLGDDELVHDVKNVTQYSELFELVESNLKQTSNSYVIADSYNFKQHLMKSLPNFSNRIIPTIPIHLADPNATVEMAKDTLFDFMLLANARFIKTHSTYGWISGFVSWSCGVFNVPLINLKPRMKFMKLFGSPKTTINRNPAQLPPPPPLMHGLMSSILKPGRSHAFKKMF
jgi:hypothetical protein